jgi:hypothetical protein
VGQTGLSKSPAARNFDLLVVGYYEGEDLIYVARLRNGFVPASRAKVFERFKGLEAKDCPFATCPSADKDAGERD